MKVFVTTLAVILLVFSISNDLWAQSTVIPTVYMVKEKESLDKIASKLISRFKAKYGNGKRIEDFKKDLMEWNPQITNWNNVPLFSNIYVDYPYPVYVSHRYAATLEAERNYSVLNSDAETPLGNNKHTVYANYTASAGNFQEKLVASQGSIKSTQNSPLSLSVGTTFLLDRTNRMISSSAYVSMLRTSKLKGDGISSNEIDVKPEYGLNAYYQQLTPWSGLSLYGGLDYEQFSTFNTTDFLEGENLALNQNKLAYVTFGGAKTFFWDDLKILVKASLSQSFLSGTTSKNMDIDEYKGQRFMLFTSLKGEGRFTYHFMFKRHMLSGPTDLTINRFGVGIGFVVF